MSPVTYNLMAALAILTGTIAAAGAASRNVTEFAWLGGPINPSQTAQGHARLQALWNPRAFKGDERAREPGPHVSFFGSAEGCDPSLANGPVSALSADLAERASSLTGVEAFPRDGTHSWTPVPDPHRCSQGVTPGPAFVVLDERHGGGLGLFTYSGDGPHLWHPYRREGQNGKGADAGVEGTFVTWIFDWKQGRAVRPWNHGPGSMLTISTEQSVQSAVTPLDKPGVKPAQVKQQFAMTLINTDCVTQRNSSLSCQVRYLFHSAVARSDPSFRLQPWIRSAHLLFDAAQNGLPVVFGPLLSRGEATRAGTVALWNSEGQSTQFAPFHKERFAAEISFAQFSALLRLIAARKQNMPLTTLSESDVVKVFGSSWAKPESWCITDINTGQEVENQHTSQAYIGGAVHSISVASE